MRAGGMRPSLEEALGPSLAGYEPRPGQQSMADAVGRALGRSERLIVEAGTGTGKSLAYLVPLSSHCVDGEKRAVVSTFTKALQRQLVEKDLPFIKEKLFGSLRFALCLGSENYLCLRRLEQAGTHGLFDDPGEHERLRRWASSTETGIRDGFGWEVWMKVAREGDLCHGRKCRHHTRCFYQRAKDRERKSHLLVVNHHLYFANLASGGKALPPFEAAVFDEAHELEDVAAEHMGREVSNLRIRHLFNSILSPQGRGVLTRLKWLEPSDFTHVAAVLNAARMNAELFFSELSLLLEGQTVRIRKKHALADNLSEHLTRLKRELDALRDSSGDEEERMEIGALSARCDSAASDLEAVLSQGLPGHVYWAERGGRSGGVLRLMATPVEVAALGVFDDLESAVFTSATLSTGGDFGYIKERLGIRDAEELLLGPQFNFGEQAALYVASDLPEPKAPAFEEGAVDRIRRIIEITRGRTLVLFTSHEMLNRASGSVRVEGVRVLKQGDDDSYRLVEELKQNSDVAIFGTNTFWQGIDVPGEALICVVIVKLPFAVPDKPVTEARAERLKGRGMDPFVHYQLPQAALLLKQGFGRLIRTSTDRGVVAILDSRMSTRWYGRVFMASLPGCKAVKDLDGIKEFLLGR